MTAKKNAKRVNELGYPILSGSPPKPTPEEAAARGPTVADALKLAKRARETMTHGSSYGWRRELKQQLFELEQLLVKLAAAKDGC